MTERFVHMLDGWFSWRVGKSMDWEGQVSCRERSEISGSGTKNTLKDFPLTSEKDFFSFNSLIVGFLHSSLTLFALDSILILKQLYSLF